MADDTPLKPSSELRTERLTRMFDVIDGGALPKGVGHPPVLKSTLLEVSAIVHRSPTMEAAHAEIKDRMYAGRSRGEKVVQQARAAGLPQPRLVAPKQAAILTRS